MSGAHLMARFLDNSRLGPVVLVVVPYCHAKRNGARTRVEVPVGLAVVVQQEGGAKRMQGDEEMKEKFDT